MANELNNKVREVCKSHLVPHPYIPGQADQDTLIKLLSLDQFRKEHVPGFPKAVNLQELYLWAFEDNCSPSRVIYLEKRFAFIEHLKSLQLDAVPTTPDEAPIIPDARERLVEERLVSSVPLVSAFLDWANKLLRPSEHSKQLAAK
jgi:hypothetical protein